MSNPVKDFTKKEWSLWLGSLLIVVVSNLFSGDVDLPTLVAALVGVTSLILPQRKCVGTDPYGGVQHPLRHHLLAVSATGVR